MEPKNEQQAEASSSNSNEEDENEIDGGSEEDRHMGGEIGSEEYEEGERDE